MTISSVTSSGNLTLARTTYISWSLKTSAAMKPFMFVVSFSVVTTTISVTSTFSAVLEKASKLSAPTRC